MAKAASVRVRISVKDLAEQVAAKAMKQDVSDPKKNELSPSPDSCSENQGNDAS